MSPSARQLWIELRAAEIAAAFLCEHAGPMEPFRTTRQELEGWIHVADDHERGRHQKSDQWHAGYLAAIIYSENSAAPWRVGRPAVRRPLIISARRAFVRD